MGKDLKEISQIKSGQTAKVIIQQNSHLFKCPLCGQGMYLYDLSSLKCPNSHCFDISKKGYVNFLTKPVKSGYDKDMFVYRKQLSCSGFFDPMIKALSDIISVHTAKREKDVFILDAGCGEGSHLARLLDELNKKKQTPAAGAGFDISKDAISLASSSRKDILWAVADLTHIPFLDKRFDIILNILSPSNYSEFKRVVKDDGFIIKVVPGSNYLKELRNLFYRKTDKQSYSNDKVINHFKESLNFITAQELTYRVPVDSKNLDAVIQMTPLSWGVNSDYLRRARSTELTQITVDFSIIVGK